MDFRLVQDFLSPDSKFFPASIVGGGRMVRYLPDRCLYLSFLERSFWALERAYIKAFYRNDSLLMDALFDAMCRYSRKHLVVDGLPILSLCCFTPLDKRLQDVSL